MPCQLLWGWGGGLHGRAQTRAPSYAPSPPCPTAAVPEPPASCPLECASLRGLGNVTGCGPGMALGGALVVSARVGAVALTSAPAAPAMDPSPPTPGVRARGSCSQEPVLCGHHFPSVGALTRCGAQPLPSHLLWAGLSFANSLSAAGGLPGEAKQAGEQLHRLPLEVHSLLAFPHLELRGAFLQKSAPHSALLASAAPSPNLCEFPPSPPCPLPLPFPRGCSSQFFSVRPHLITGL